MFNIDAFKKYEFELNKIQLINSLKKQFEDVFDYRFSVEQIDDIDNELNEFFEVVKERIKAHRYMLEYSKAVANFNELLSIELNLEVFDFEDDDFDFLEEEDNEFENYFLEDELWEGNTIQFIRDIFLEYDLEQFAIIRISCDILLNGPSNSFKAK